MRLPRAHRDSVVAAAMLAALLACVPAGTALAEETIEENAVSDGEDTGGETALERSRREEALEAVRQDIEASRTAEMALAAEIDGLRQDRAALNEQLIATATRIKDIEGAIGEVEDRLAPLEEREDQLHASFRARSGLLAELLGALQRMGRRPPPAVLVSPDDALKSVRAAIVLGAVLPRLRIETEALASDLEELAQLKRQIEGEKTRLLASNRDLDGERRRIAALIDAKNASAEKTEGELAQIRERAEKLANEAQNLEELIASLDREIAVSRQQARAADQPPPSARDALGALNNPSRLEPAIAFEDAQGLLAMPANGAITRDFGAPDEFGSASRGILLATRANAQVTAPNDGWVVYAGPFRSYGQLLILNAGDGYHVLLAGMDKITVSLGQFVLAGEPVGQMGGLVLASAANVTVGRSQPVLYIEFREDGRSIDPAPWWAKGRTGAAG